MTNLAAEARPRVEILGVRVDAINMSTAVARVASWIATGTRAYVCVTGVHGVMESQRDAALLDIHNISGMTTPDGVPLKWCGRWAGAQSMTRVYGPDLMLALCEAGIASGWRHYFYGGAPGIPERVAAELSRRFPGLQVAGCYSPPFRPLNESEDADVVAKINESKPDLVWVGLGTPKQERWMAAHRPVLKAGALLGVGAAFDIHAGALRQAPALLRRNGLEWAFRLAMEPRRLWRRYLSCIPQFLWQIARRPPRLVP